MVALWVLGLFIGAAFVPLRMIGQSATCQSNVYRITRAQLVYAEDFDGRFSPAASWMDLTFPYVVEERRLHCPAVSRPGERTFGYAMNPALASKVRAKIEEPDLSPLHYDSVHLSRSAAAGIDSLPRPGRHVTRARKDSPSRRGNYVGYVGGNARIVLDAGVRESSGARR